MTANSLRRCSKLDLSNELLAAALANETSKIGPVPGQGGREHKRGSEASTPSHVFRGGLSAWNFSEVSVSTGGVLTRHPGTPRLRCNDPCKRRNASWRASYAVIGERATPVPGEGGGGGGARAFIRRTTNPAASFAPRRRIFMRIPLSRHVCAIWISRTDIIAKSLRNVITKRHARRGRFRAIRRERFT